LNEQPQRPARIAERAGPVGAEAPGVLRGGDAIEAEGDENANSPARSTIGSVSSRPFVGTFAVRATPAPRARSRATVWISNIAPARSSGSPPK
jgi:hypothetical protein